MKKQKSEVDASVMLYPLDETSYDKQLVVKFYWQLQHEAFVKRVAFYVVCMYAEAKIMIR